MNDLRKAAEMALEALCLTNNEAVPDDIEERREAAIEALRQAIEQAEKPPVKSYCGGKPNYCTPEEVLETPPCKTHPDAPHGFDRNVSHNLGRYVCECEFWEPVDAVNMTPDRVDETAKGKHEPFIYIREDTEMPFGGFERCGEHDPGAFPVYLAPPKREWVGLTDEEIQAERHKLDSTAGWTYDHFARAIEAKLKEKNSPEGGA